MAIVMIDDQLQTEFQAISDPDQDFSVFLAALVKDAIARRKHEAAARAEAQAVLNGPRRPFDPAATYQRYKEKFGWDDQDFSHLSGDELVEDTDRLIDAMPPEKQAALEREGWL